MGDPTKTATKQVLLTCAASTHSQFAITRSASGTTVLVTLLDLNGQVLQSVPLDTAVALGPASDSQLATVLDSLFLTAVAKAGFA